MISRSLARFRSLASGVMGGSGSALGGSRFPRLSRKTFGAGQIGRQPTRRRQVNPARPAHRNVKTLAASLLTQAPLDRQGVRKFGNHKGHVRQPRRQLQIGGTVHHRARGFG